MSASKQKQARTDSVSKRTKAQQEEEQKRRSFNIKAIIFTAVFVVVVAVAFFVNSNFLAKHSTAVTVGNTNYTATEFEYFYRSSYNQFYNNYSSYINYLIDTSTPLDQQQYSETETWADFFKSAAMTDLSQVTALYDQAKASGYQLSEEGKATIENSISNANAVAVYNGFADANAYLATAYGAGMNIDIYRDMFTIYMTATEYRDFVVDGFEYTDDEKAAHYAEIADDYDMITYESYYISTTDTKYADMDEDAAKAAVKADCEAVVKDAKTPLEFLANVKKLDDTVTNTTYTANGSTLNSLTKDWMVDASRQFGDTTVVESTAGCYAIMFTGRDDNSYNTVQVRQVFVAAPADESGAVSADALAQAQSDAEAALAELGESFTEDEFATMINVKTGTADGGLYKTVAKGMLGDEFDAFAFDAARKPGDTAVVYNPGSYYTNGAAGYYVVYFVGLDEVYSIALADSDLRANDTNAWITEISSGYEPVEKSGMRFAQLG